MVHRESETRGPASDLGGGAIAGAGRRRGAGGQGWVQVDLVPTRVELPRPPAQQDVNFPNKFSATRPLLICSPRLTHLQKFALFDAL